MLGLKSVTRADWVPQVIAHLDEVLIDHAHCEKKAAGTAMNLIFAYVDREPLCRELSEIVVEELDHFRMVLDLLARRGIKFRRLSPSEYGRKLNDLVNKIEPQKAVDRLLVASLIEARSCERFAALRDGLPDAELAAFYGSLFESEARHHTTYVRMARMFAPDDVVDRRLAELAAAEAEIIDTGEPAVRVHS